MKKSYMVVLAAAWCVTGVASAQVYSVDTIASPPDYITVVNSSSLIVEEVPANKITAEFTDRDCPAGTTLIFDIGDMNQAKCVWSYDAQKQKNEY